MDATTRTLKFESPLHRELHKWKKAVKVLQSVYDKAVTARDAAVEHVERTEPKLQGALDAVARIEREISLSASTEDGR